MAKWALVNKNNGGLTDICDEADKFDVYDGSDAEFKWCEIPDDAAEKIVTLKDAVTYLSANSN